jgi:hypothetical protein
MSSNIKQPLRKRANLINHPPQPYASDQPTPPLPQCQHVLNTARIMRTSDDTVFKEKASLTFSSLHSRKTVSLLFRVVIFLALSSTIFLINNQTKYIGHAAGNTVTFTPSIISYSNPDMGNPWRGQYLWGGWTTAIDEQLIPQPGPAVDSYHRYSWASLESTQGNYTFSAIDTELSTARARGGKFGFRVMAANDAVTGSALVPNYLVNDMVGDTNAYWTGGCAGCGYYVPDFNSPYFMSRAEALIAAIAARYANDPRLGWVEVGFNGLYGEWVWGFAPNPATGQVTPYMTDANKKTLIDYWNKEMPHTRLVVLIEESGDGYGFTYSMNTYPKMTWRYDCLGNPGWSGSGALTALQNRENQYGALAQNRWMTTPILTEFCGLPPGTSQVPNALTDVTRYHIDLVDGNNQPWSDYGSTDQATITNIMQHAGYRVQLDNVSLPSQLVPNTSFSVTTQWSNVNVTPLYNPWNIMIQLKDSSGNVVWQGKSAFDLQTLLPTNSSGTDVPVSVTDTFTLPGTIASGTYTVAVQIVDPANYYTPLNLADSGRLSDGSYNLGQLTVSSNPSPTPTNTPTPTSSDTVPPTVTILSPLNGSTVSRHSNVTITASASDDVGVTQVSYSINGSLLRTTTTSPYTCSWSVPGKPNTTYTITATAYDIAGLTGTNSVTVTAK